MISLYQTLCRSLEFEDPLNEEQLNAVAALAQSRENDDAARGLPAGAAIYSALRRYIADKRRDLTSAGAAAHA
jgi:hypothetical protein